MKINLWMLCAVVCLLPATIVAQAPERPRVGVGRAYSLGDIVIVAADAAVQKELGLSPETAAKLKVAENTFVENIREKLPPGSLRFRMGVADDGGFRSVQGTTFETRDAFKACVDQYLLELKNFLIADQYIRLQQLNWQVMGTSAFSEADVVEALMFSKEQQELIRSIQDEFGAKRQLVFPEGGGPLRNSTETREKLAKLNIEEDLKINGALTKHQLALFETMRGQEFDVSDLRNGRRGLGNGRLLRPSGNRGMPPLMLLIQNQRIGIFQLIEGKNLQTELAIGADDTIKLRKLASEFRVAAREIVGALPNVQGMLAADAIQVFQKMARADAAVAERLLPELKALLTADQYVRLQQIHWQVIGAMALSERDVIEALSITKIQQDLIMTTCAEFEDKKAELVTSGSGGPGPALRNNVQELSKEYDLKLENVLTTDQLERFKLLKGRAFDVSQVLARGQSPVLGQRADPDFDVSIAHPSYVDRHPAVLFDEAHRNFHTSTIRYTAFADLITNDGYQISPGREKFTPDQLTRYEILIIANAPASSLPSKSAFSEEECDTIQNWVKGGGSLLLITDHEPFGSGSRDLAQRFGVNMSTRATVDPENNSVRGLLFSREKNQIGDHPIMKGRNDSEIVNRVLTFTGQSLEGPPGSVALLRFGDTAQENGEEGKTFSAAGRTQGVALKYERGRVVVMGEAAQLSAQLSGVPPQPMGMNVPGCDNRKMAINLIHWLSRLLD